MQQSDWGDKQAGARARRIGGFVLIAGGLALGLSARRLVPFGAAAGWVTVALALLFVAAVLAGAAIRWRGLDEVGRQLATNTAAAMGVVSVITMPATRIVGTAAALVDPVTASWVLTLVAGGITYIVQLLHAGKADRA